MRLLSALLIALLGACSSTALETEDELRIRDFDPAAPERQDATYLCETDTTCSLLPRETQAHFYHAIGTDCGWSDPLDTLWRQDGYFFWFVMSNIGDIRRIRLQLELRVGDPRDQYDSRFWINDSRRGTPQRHEVLTSTQVEQGVELNLGTERASSWGDSVFIFIQLQPIGRVYSRTIQWALAPGGITDLERATPVHICRESGPFLRVPRHGFLHLAEGPGGEPQCVGTPLMADATSPDPYLVPYGLYRTTSNPTLAYLLRDLDHGQFVQFDFQGLRGFIDWFLPDNVCAQTNVLTDDLVRSLSASHRLVGIYPRVGVTWRASDGRVHHGVTDRNLTIQDFGTEPLAAGMAINSRYYWFISGGMDIDSRELDIQTLLDSYRFVPGDRAYVLNMDNNASIDQYFR